jgi:hypothetical protein
MKEIILNNTKTTNPNYRKYKALVDDEDYERVSQFNWYADIHEFVIYARMTNGSRILMHTFITGFKMTDHKDNDGLNNQRSNLRQVTVAQNMMNSRKKRNASSKFKGVYLAKYANKWCTQIYINHKSNHVGYFNSEIEAALAYNKAAKKHFKEFAKLNTI